MLADQPLFRLIAAIIVLLITDYQPKWGVLAAIVWLVWVLTPHFLSKNISFG
jgi:hypothetical protein